MNTLDIWVILGLSIKYTTMCSVSFRILMKGGQKYVNSNLGGGGGGRAIGVRSAP